MIKTLRPLVLAGLLLPLALPSHAAVNTTLPAKVQQALKANKLQDASNKRMINADAKLKEVFGKPQVSMFEMAGLIGKHVS